jgi:2-keto-3-deoxy-L-rhamnonate aldolase RhmA
MRYNKIIDLLEHGQPVFSTSTVPNGSLDDLTYIADADYDAVIIEMEHEGFSFTTLRTSLQVLLNRKRIAEKGNLQPDVVPVVRIPPNARERNQWVIKQALDTGVYGLVLPHLSGNILLMGIVEEAEGVQNIRDILRQVRGIGAIWAGPGDMSVSMGIAGPSQPSGRARKSAARPGRLQRVRRPLCDGSHG